MRSAPYRKNRSPVLNAVPIVIGFWDEHKTITALQLVNLITKTAIKSFDRLFKIGILCFDRFLNLIILHSNLRQLVPA